MTSTQKLAAISFLCGVKVLILHQHFRTPYEGGAIRSYYLAKALVDAGIETIVVTGSNRSEYEQKNIDGIRVHYLPIAYQNQFGFYKRTWSFFKYILKSASVVKNIKDVKVCYAISVPLTIGIAALRIRARYKIPYIFEVGDLWPDAPVQMGFIRNSVLKNLLYKLEKLIYRKAQAIVALSPSIQAAILKKEPGAKIHLIPNFSDTEFFFPEKKDNTIEEKFNVKGKFVVSYIGALGVANGLDYLLQCAEVSQQKSLPIHFMIAGEGAMGKPLEREITGRKLDNVSMIGFVNRDGVKEILNITDASFISFQPFPILETGSPNKYFDGLAAGKLIIVNFEGWVKEEIEREGCGVYCENAKPEGFVTQLIPFIKDLPLLEKYQRNARNLAESKYARTTLGKAFVDVIKK